MRILIKNLFLFGCVLALAFELIIRFFHLTSDIPERRIDAQGIQRYKPHQTGYYTKATEPWIINDMGWSGKIDTQGRAIIGVVGDSYIENFMNPYACHQGILFKEKMPEYAFFEAARSGVSFIEAMEISQVIDKEVHTQFHVVYLSDMDFYESMADLKALPDRIQISLKENKIIPATLKNPMLKKILYSSKLLYYLYLRFPVLVNQQNKAESKGIHFEEYQFKQADFDALFTYCKQHYELGNMLWVFHSNTNERIVETAKRFGVNTISVHEPTPNTWASNQFDNHWNCEGHKAINLLVADTLRTILNSTMTR
jgi:hypothetical protein